MKSADTEALVGVV